MSKMMVIATFESEGEFGFYDNEKKHGEDHGGKEFEIKSEKDFSFKWMRWVSGKPKSNKVKVDDGFDGEILESEKKLLDADFTENLTAKSKPKLKKD